MSLTQRQKICLKTWQIKNLCTRLFFSELREDSPEKQKISFSFDPEGLVRLYLKAMADSHIFPLNKSIDDIFQGDESVSDILEMAVRFEKDT